MGLLTELRGILRADFLVNHGRASRVTLVAFRLSQARTRRRLPRALEPVAKLLQLVWIEGVMGAELPGGVQCGPGLRLPHGGRGVILHPRVTIGADVTVYHRVTVGVSGPDPSAVPTIGDGVYLGTGATVIGRVDLGRGARVGAGAVVVDDVPAMATAVGVPARVVRGATEPPARASARRRHAGRTLDGV